MTGYGVSYGAISVLNAIPCGIGATIGIDLKTEAWFTKDTESTKLITDEKDTLLIRTCVKNTLSAIGVDDVNYNLRIKSEIPPSIGLKSSSSVANAVVFAVLNEYHFPMDVIDAIRIGVKSSRESKVTVTGSFDDACAAHFGGFIQTDNYNDEIQVKRPIEEYDVILVVGDKRKSKISIERYAPFKDKSFELSMHASKCPWNTMEENSRIISKVSGTDISICEKAKELGALAAGISGTGPAIAIVTEKGKGKEIADHLNCRTMITTTRNSEEISFCGGNISGTVELPSSKSATIRAIFMAVLSGKECTIHNPLYSYDTYAAIDAAKAFGATVTCDAEKIIVCCTHLTAPKIIDVGNSGTVLRFAIAMSALLSDEIVIKGDKSITKRPIDDLLASLSSCGAECSFEKEIRIKGPLKSTSFRIDCSKSSQYLSALLLISPVIGRPVDIEIAGNTVSEPYVALTTSMMKLFGVTLTKNDDSYHVEPTGYDGFEYTVPTDMSSAATVMAAGAMSGNITVKGNFLNIVPDSKIILIMKLIGCIVDNSKKEIFCSYSGRLKSAEIDLSDNPDLFPILAVLLSTANGTSKLYGAPHLRYKESDRISNVVENLRSMGANIEATNDGCIINGVPRLHGAKINHRDDHRIMMAFAVASLVSDEPVIFDNDNIWNISFPGFPELMMSAGMKVR